MNYPAKSSEPGKVYCRSLTLIEVLVVITIISILIALLMPSLRSAKDQANTVICMSNLRQIGLAMNMYGVDSGRYPWGYEWGIPTDWTYTLNPYFQKLGGITYWASVNSRSDVIQCPSRALKPTNIVNCYGAHEKLFGGTYPGSPYTNTAIYPRRFPWRERLSDTFMLADADQQSTLDGGQSHATLWNIQPDMDQDYNPATANNIVSNVGDNKDDLLTLGQIRWRHNGNTRANFLFVDGHVESIQINNLREKQLKITGP